jgi:23S rRNA (adenine2503-C2)-methyltransferase
LDILGYTFEEVCGAVGVRPGSVDGRSLRDSYRRLMHGSAEPDEACLSPLRAEVHPVVRQQVDGALVKFVQRAEDGLEIESVIVPMQRRGKSWSTLCVSSQIGCARGCTFCETGQMGLLRQLSASEIVGQVVAARQTFGADIRNVVFMGMGEPLDNLDAVIQAIRVLGDRRGLSIGKPRIRISTVGRVDGIRRLAALGWRRINLAISLNAPNDDIRSQIMPINRLEPMAVLREALLAYPLRNCQFFMVEYVLIPQVNDRPEHAIELAEFLRPVRCCVNVIPYNPQSGPAYGAPTERKVVTFVEAVRRAGQYCKRRITKGRDQMAACGQLGNRALSRSRARPAADA